MNIDAILARKRAGIDCTEDESAYVKQMLHDVAILLPLEWDEAHLT